MPFLLRLSGSRAILVRAEHPSPSGVGSVKRLRGSGATSPISWAAIKAVFPSIAGPGDIDQTRRVADQCRVAQAGSWLEGLATEERRREQWVFRGGVVARQTGLRDRNGGKTAESSGSLREKSSLSD